MGTVKEFCKVFCIEKKEFKGVFKIITRLRASEEIIMPAVPQGNGFINKSRVEMFAVKYAYQLKLNSDTIGAIQKIAKKVMEKEMLTGRRPANAAGSIIYLACLASEDVSQKRSFKEIAIVTKSGDGPIANGFRDCLFDKRLSIIPKGYGDRNDIRNMTITRSGKVSVF